MSKALHKSFELTIVNHLSMRSSYLILNKNLSFFKYC